TTTTDQDALALHDALPIYRVGTPVSEHNDDARQTNYARGRFRLPEVSVRILTPADAIAKTEGQVLQSNIHGLAPLVVRLCRALRSEEHTSELQSRENLVCR